MRFPYSRREIDPLPGESGLQVIHEPIILVRFIGPDRSYLIRGLLDTGASLTLVPETYASRLGVVPGDRGKLSSAGGPIGLSLAALDLELTKGRKSYRWSARVGSTPRTDNLALLGHMGFLEHFTTTFNGQFQHVTLRFNGTASASKPVRRD